MDFYLCVQKSRIIIRKNAFKISFSVLETQLLRVALNGNSFIMVSHATVNHIMRAKFILKQINISKSQKNDLITFGLMKTVYYVIFKKTRSVH